MVYSLNIWGLFGYNNTKKETAPTQKSDEITTSDGPVSATTSVQLEKERTVFSFKLDGPENFENTSSSPTNDVESTETVTADDMASNTEEKDLELELEEKFDGAAFAGSGVKSMPKYNTARRSSKRFVIGDELDEETAASPETEVLLTVPNPEWLQASAKLKPGTTLT